MNRALVDRIAAAVLYEGYILYPYRPSIKNHQRWTFGGLFPEDYTRSHRNGDASGNQTECLIHGTRASAFDVRVRFLHLTARQVGVVDTSLAGRPDDGEVPPFRPVESLRAGGTIFQTWQEAEELCARLSTGDIAYGLPTEAEWERAARGGLVGHRYPWGDEPPTAERCDFDRFDHFSILPPRLLPPNGYGLYAMTGSVWEWTADWYDAEYYRTSSADDPTGPPTGAERVLRGGSWADCAETVTVSFRMSRSAVSWRDGGWGEHLTANIGFRLCRKAAPVT